MSIAQARASRVRPHYILVALLLGVVAAIAFGTLAARAGAGDTTGLFKGQPRHRRGRGCRHRQPVRTMGDGSLDLLFDERWQILPTRSCPTAVWTLKVQADRCAGGQNGGWDSDHLRWGVGLRKWSTDDDHCVGERRSTNSRKTATTRVRPRAQAVTVDSKYFPGGHDWGQATIDGQQYLQPGDELGARMRLFRSPVTVRRWPSPWPFTAIGETLRRESSTASASKDCERLHRRRREHHASR